MLVLFVMTAASVFGQGLRGLPLPSKSTQSSEFRTVVAEYAPSYGGDVVVIPSAQNTKIDSQDAEIVPVPPVLNATFVGQQADEISSDQEKRPNKFTESFKKASDATKNWFVNAGHSVTSATRKSVPKDEQWLDEVHASVESPSPSALLSQGVRNELENHFPEAEQDYLQVIRLQQQLQKRQESWLGNKTPPENVVNLGNVYHRLAVVCWRQEKRDIAEGYFKRALSLSAWNSIQLTTDYALFLEECQKYRQSEVLMRNALVDNPNDARVQRLLGRSLAYQNRFQEALRYLIPAVGERGAAVEMAEICHKMGDEESAKQFESKIIGKKVTKAFPLHPRTVARQFEFKKGGKSYLAEVLRSDIR
jgi:tetratricopeptide (TPR) repeat protein